MKWSRLIRKGRKRLETVGNGQWSGQGWSENKWWNEYFYQTIYSNKLSFCSWPSPPTTRHLWPLLPCWGINIPTYRAHQPCQVWSSSYCIVTYNTDMQKNKILTQVVFWRIQNWHENNVIRDKKFIVTSLIIIKFYTFGAQIDNFVPCNPFLD